jgi:hypothetical protein
VKGWSWLVVVIVVLLLAGGAVVAVRKLSESEATRLAKLQPDVRDRVQQLREAAAAEGIETFVGSTKRSDDEQAAKLAAGLSTTSNSWHELGRALELYVMAPDSAGKLQPDFGVKMGTADKYRRLHKLSKRFGGNGIPYTGEDGGAPFTADGKPAKLSNGIWDVGHIEFRQFEAGAYDPKKALSWSKAAARLGVA